MSHTLHRKGNAENLANDYVMFAMSAKGFNSENSKYALREYLEIVDKFDWVNMGDMKTGGFNLVGKEAIFEGVQDTSIVQCVFKNKAELSKAVAAIKEADLGISVTISAIVADTHEVLLENDIGRHTVEVSLGISGRTDKLPPDELLEITTMCGHGMVSQGFVRKMLIDIKKNRRTSWDAAQYLTTPCVCGVFNPVRAQALLEELLDVWCMDEN